jgi:hypothetical protein
LTITTSNAVFVTARAVPPKPAVGWQVRVLSLTAGFTPVANIDRFVELSVGPELNATGAGSITLYGDDPLWSTELFNGAPASTLLETEHIWECYEDGVLRFQFLGQTVDDVIVEDSETRTITISGPGIADMLRWAKVLMPGNVKPDNLSWSFAGIPSMSAYLTLLHAAQARGTIPWVKPTFTAGHDSGGAPWFDLHPAITSVYAPDLGTDLLAVLGDLTGQDISKVSQLRADWVMWPGFRLDVRATIGTHRERQVIFFEGNLAHKERNRVRTDITNVIQVRDSLGKTATAIDSASVGRYARREELKQENSAYDATRRAQISQVILAQHKDESSSWTIEVPYDTPGRKVFADYDLGDWIGVSRYNGAAPSTVEAFRVMAITVRVASDATVTVELTLQTLQDAQQRAMAIRLLWLEAQVDNHIPGGPGAINIPAIPTTPVPIGFDPNTGQIGLMPVGSFPFPGTDSFPPGTTLPDGSTVLPDGSIRLPDGTIIPAGGASGSGWGSLGGADCCHVFIQHDDPAGQAKVGDFWFQIPAG